MFWTYLELALFLYPTVLSEGHQDLRGPETTQKALPISTATGIILLKEATLPVRHALPSCTPNKLIENGKHECKWCHLIMQICCLATFSPAPVRNQSYLHSQLCLWNLWKSISCHFSHYTISRRFWDMKPFSDMKVNMVKFGSNPCWMWIW